MTMHYSLDELRWIERQHRERELRRTAPSTPHIDRALAEVSPPESENDRIWRLLSDAARGT